jgi:hypothetical protein
MLIVKELTGIASSAKPLVYTRKSAIETAEIRLMKWQTDSGSLYKAPVSCDRAWQLEQSAAGDHRGQLWSCTEPFYRPMGAWCHGERPRAVAERRERRSIRRQRAQCLPAQDVSANSGLLGRSARAFFEEIFKLAT